MVLGTFVAAFFTMHMCGFRMRYDSLLASLGDVGCRIVLCFFFFFARKGCFGALAKKKKRDGRKKGGKGHFFGCLDCGNGLAGKREVEVETTGARLDE